MCVFLCTHKTETVAFLLLLLNLLTNDRAESRGKSSDGERTVAGLAGTVLRLLLLLVFSFITDIVTSFK